MKHTPLELSDRDSDSLTMHIDTEGLWVTCTSGADEVNVGPLDQGQLIDWLTAE